ncbi:MAG: efflux RND transporter periplasmic adaptor subunit [Gammaproteobacteria bacterium]|nr:efflux RND transporter periplasmic adaptor subunit [Gammaproteobacteria bacterium]
MLKKSLQYALLTLFAASVLSINALAAPHSRSAPVVVVAAQLKQLAPVTWVAGTIISRNDAKLATEVEGRLKRVAEVGARVKEDQVVARVDNTFVNLEIEELESAVEREKAQLSFLREEVKRLQRLEKQNNASKTRLEQTRADRDIARNNLNIARTRLQLAKEGKWRHEIRAPFTGVIAERYVQAGERVNKGDQVVRLIDAVAMEVRASVPLISINYITEGSKLVLSVEQSERVEIEGVVRTIVPVGDERSGLMDLRINFKSRGWRVGQPVRVALPTANPKKTLVVPRDALVLRRGGIAVYKVNEDNKAEKIPVSLGIAAGDFVEVIGQVQSGDKIIVRGAERLRPGQSVNIIPAIHP